VLIFGASDAVLFIRCCHANLAALLSLCRLLLLLLRLYPHAQLQRLPATLVFYAPPHGLESILSDCLDVLGPGRQVVVARELTKLHEEFFRWVVVGRHGLFVAPWWESHWWSTWQCT
jgi:hypothetical protein